MLNVPLFTYKFADFLLKTIKNTIKRSFELVLNCNLLINKIHALKDLGKKFTFFCLFLGLGRT